MDLKNFIKTTIIEISQAVKESAHELNEEIFLGTKADKRCIEFDVAVSVEESKTKGGKAGIKVLEFAGLSGGIDKETKIQQLVGFNLAFIHRSQKKLCENLGLGLQMAILEKLRWGRRSKKFIVSVHYIPIIN